MKNKKTIFLIAMIFIIPVIWFYYPMFIGNQISFIEIALEKPNEFGDLYGALNTLFSGFAFLGIIASIFIQSEELNDTRREIAKQTEQFSSQTDAMFKQSFENTFFQLLGLNNEIIKMAAVKIKYTEVNGDVIILNGTGRDAFKDLSIYFSFFKKKHKSDACESVYEKFHSEVDDVLGHYFRSIYQSLKLIDNASLNHIQKKEYANMLRAQMSKHELGLLFYNCISGLGVVKFKPLIEKYEFFEHLSTSVQIDSELLLKYDISVFGFTNREYFERYIIQLAKQGMIEERYVYGYFAEGNEIKRKPIVPKISPYTNSKCVRYTINSEVFPKVKDRSLIWVEVLLLDE